MNLSFAKTSEVLDFTSVLANLAEHAVADVVKSKILSSEPYLNLDEINRHQRETSEARILLESLGSPPLGAMQGLEEVLILTGTGVALQPEQLLIVALFLTTCRRLKDYLRKGEGLETSVANFGRSLINEAELEAEITRCIRGSMVDTYATPKLTELRKKIDLANSSIQSKLNQLIRSNKRYFSDSFIAKRGDHYTLPVRKEYKSSVPGTVIAISQSGETLFIEPTVISKSQEELNSLLLAEENEVLRILYELTALVELALPSLRRNMEALEIIDFVFAKAKYSLEIKAREAEVHDQKRIIIKGGRHPLIDANKVVPLDFQIGDSIDSIVITGPNTGGKTVALKTVGILSLMAQCGFHVPVSAGSSFAFLSQILCDIGDNQSLSENLSTFSAHMTNIISILNSVDSDSLVLMDELGTGTDPAEGMGLAIAILEEMQRRSGLQMATTHYPEIKDFAESKVGFCNARMTFDKISLQPLYRLEIGFAGESCALDIASGLGLDSTLIQRAKQIAYREVGISTSTPTRFINEESISIQKAPSSSSRLQRPRKVNNEIQSLFTRGDSVILPDKRIAIVFRSADRLGRVEVQCQGKRFMINHKRLQLQTKANELYPEGDYDLDIVFESVKVRKARKIMKKRHEVGNIIEEPPLKS